MLKSLNTPIHFKVCIPSVVVFVAFVLCPVAMVAQSDNSSRKKATTDSYLRKQKRLTKKATKGTKKRTSSSGNRNLSKGGHIRKEEKPFTKDIAGRTLRTRRYGPKKSKYTVEKPPRNYYVDPQSREGIIWQTGWFDRWNKNRIQRKAIPRENSWKGDIAGKFLRNTRPYVNEVLRKPISTSKWLLMSGNVQGHQKKLITRSEMRKNIRRTGLFAGTWRRKMPGPKAIKIRQKPFSNVSHSVAVRIPQNRSAIKAASYTGTIRFRKKEDLYRERSARLGGAQTPVKIRVYKYTNSVRAAQWDGAQTPVKIRIYKYTNSVRAARWDGAQTPVKIRIYKYTNSVRAARWDGAQTPVKIRIYKYTNSVRAARWDGARTPIGVKPHRFNMDWVNFQGNTKIRRFSGHGLHPDAQFAHGFIRNAKGNKTFLTSLKLVWEKTFNKKGTVPPHLKKSPQKSRYDKGEKDLWFR